VIEGVTTRLNEHVDVSEEVQERDSVNMGLVKVNVGMNVNVKATIVDVCERDDDVVWKADSVNEMEAVKLGVSRAEAEGESEYERVDADGENEEEGEFVCEK
jgi:hypothetical protein